MTKADFIVRDSIAGIAINGFSLAQNKSVKN